MSDWMDASCTNARRAEAFSSSDELLFNWQRTPGLHRSAANAIKIRDFMNKSMTVSGKSFLLSELSYYFLVVYLPEF